MTKFGIAFFDHKRKEKVALEFNLNDIDTTEYENFWEHPVDDPESDLIYELNGFKGMGGEIAPWPSYINVYETEDDLDPAYQISWEQIDMMDNLDCKKGYKD